MKYQFSILRNLFFKKYLKWFIIYLFFMLIEIYIVTSTPDINTKKENNICFKYGIYFSICIFL